MYEKIKPNEVSILLNLYFKIVFCMLRAFGISLNLVRKNMKEIRKIVNILKYNILSSKTLQLVYTFRF